MLFTTLGIKQGNLVCIITRLARLYQFLSGDQYPIQKAEKIWKGNKLLYRDSHTTGPKQVTAFSHLMILEYHFLL
jgi:hypothetical protein